GAGRARPRVAYRFEVAVRGPELQLAANLHHLDVAREGARRDAGVVRHLDGVVCVALVLVTPEERSHLDATGRLAGIDDDPFRIVAPDLPFGLDANLFARDARDDDAAGEVRDVQRALRPDIERALHDVARLVVLSGCRRRHEHDERQGE